MQNSRGRWTVVLLTLFLASVNPLQAAQRVFKMKEKDFVMTQEEASRLNLSLISPILQRIGSDPRENPNLTKRIKTFVLRLQRGEIFYAVSPGFFPLADREKRIGTINKMQFDKTLGQAGVILFMPAVLYWKDKLPQKEFEYLVAISFAHEVMHIENLNLFQEDPAGEEAYTWWLTIKLLIRPLQMEGVHIESFSQMSARLYELGDDWKRPEWLKLFR